TVMNETPLWSGDFRAPSVVDVAHVEFLRDREIVVDSEKLFAISGQRRNSNVVTMRIIGERESQRGIVRIVVFSYLRRSGRRASRHRVGQRDQIRIQKR